MSRAEPSPPAPAARSYDDDFFAWTQHTAALLRAGRFVDVDVEHLAEEVEDMGKRERRELESRLEVLLVHLLKWRHQPEHRSASWRRTVITQRTEIERLLRDSPSLQPRVTADLARRYGAALQRIAIETGLAVEEFPRICPWSAGEILDATFFPE